MSTKSNITLAITTYQRPSLLSRCLQSICHQSLLPSRIIIIDNDPQKSAAPIFKKYQKRLPLQYYYESQKGTPHARNAAINLVKTKYVGFIDDDCILHKNWFQQAFSCIQDSNLTFIIGLSFLQNKNNIFAQSQFNYYQQWFNSQVSKKPLSPELFDTKNIIINCDLFKENKFKFDKIFGNSSISGFEDIDMGYQFAHKKFYGRYEPKMIVYHQEINTFLKMIKKSYERGRLKFLLNQKWHISEKQSSNLYKKISYTIKKIIKNPLKITSTTLIEIIDYSFKLGYNYQKNQIQP